MCLDSNLEVEYSTAHLFDEEGKISRTRQSHGDQYPMPHDELSELVEWGAEQFRGYFSGDFSEYVG
jgi:hypothetical protein